MSISRHKLYAAGEPLGDSVTRNECGRVVCGGGGGGGGDGGAAEREAARQARVDQATRAVNTLFGVGANAEKNAAARDSLYGQIGADTRDFFSKQLAEDAEEALRQKRFIAARNGTFGSSQNLDMQREFDRRNDRGLLDIANRSAAAMNDARSADEKSRIDLISRIVGGADQDSATSSARAQLQANADAARTNAMQNRMANVFAGSLDAWRGYNTAAGEAAAQREFDKSMNGNYYSNNRSYQGTVTR